MLGSNDVTVQEMASVYATFANGGVYVPPVYVTKHRTIRRHGVVRGPPHPGEGARARGREHDLVDPARRDRIGHRHRREHRPSGRRQDRDHATTTSTPGSVATPAQLATAVWVGFRPRPGPDGQKVSIDMNPPNTRITVNGGAYPAQIWASFMKKALEGQPDLPLFDPASTPPPTTTVPASDSATLSPVKAPTQSTMPDLTGMRTDQALAAVTSAGLSPSRVDVASGVAPGLVTSQSPPAGVKLQSGSTVYVESSPGAFVPPNVIPDIRGFGANQAQTDLTAQGYTVTLESAAPPPGAVGRDGTPIVPGQVWRTTPAAGQPSPDGRITVTWMPASAALPGG